MDFLKCRPQAAAEKGDPRHRVSRMWLTATTALTSKSGNGGHGARSAGFHTFMISCVQTPLGMLILVGRYQLGKAAKPRWLQVDLQPGSHVSQGRAATWFHPDTLVTRMSLMRCLNLFMSIMASQAWAWTDSEILVHSRSFQQM